MNDLSGIKSWPLTERPRERLLAEGADKLSTAELLAVLLRNGTRGKDAVTFSRELLAKFGGLRGFLSAEAKALKGEKGLGPAKIAALAAAGEIFRRALREEIIGKNAIRDPESVLNYLYASMRDRKKEVFKVLFLDKANRVIDEQNLFEGTVDEAAVHPREVVKAALDRHATGIILVHNHPSGRTEPSVEDRAITAKLQSACSSVGLKILDHLIVGDDPYFSFSERGLI